MIKIIENLQTYNESNDDHFLKTLNDFADDNDTEISAFYQTHDNEYGPGYEASIDKKITNFDNFKQIGVFNSKLPKYQYIGPNYDNYLIIYCHGGEYSVRYKGKRIARPRLYVYNKSFKSGE